MYIYSIDNDNTVNETPSYKIGLENVYIAYGTKEKGMKQYRITFYLPGAKPVSLQFSKESVYDHWKNRLSYFPEYDVDNYPYRYPVVYKGNREEVGIMNSSLL